jgi:RNA polymerase sigma-70 factor, ECF subfamily
MKPSAADGNSEVSVIERAQKGEVAAFEELYRQHVGRIYGLCLRMLRQPDRAEDCTQQTFINAWQSLRSFQVRSAFGTWLHRIAVNVVLAQRPHTVQGMAPSDTVDVEQGWVLDTPVEVSELEAAIASLPAGARDVLVLSGIYGYSHAEVASMLGIAEGTCKAQLHRARLLLRKRLASEENEK